MKKGVEEAIKKYQCPGCSVGSGISCFESIPNYGEACGKHFAGTFITGIGKIFLGMPKGFNRLGKQEDMRIRLWTNFNDEYNMWNVPTWKYKNKQGHTIVRGLMPRRNEAFLDIFLEDCIDKIDCQEITNEDIRNMD